MLDLHFENILIKSFRLLGFITRVSKSFKHKDTYIYLYNTLVRSQLEYATSIWNPHYNIYVDKIERVQKRFVRTLNYRMRLPRASYVKLLTQHKLLTLKNRRTIADIAVLRKICVNEFDCPELLSQINFRVPSKRTRSKSLFDSHQSRTNAGKRAPLRRLCVLHDSYCNDLDMFSYSHSAFKKELNKVL